MKFKITFILLALFCSLQNLFAQEEKGLRDSVQVLLDQPVHDSIKIENIVQFKTRHWFSAQLELQVFDLCLELARRNQLYKKEIHFLLEKGYVLQMSGETMAANDNYGAAAKLAEQKKDTAWMMNAYYRQGYLLHGVGRPMEAIELWKKILPLKNDERMQGFFYMIIGAAYLEADSIDLALDYSHRAYDIMKKDTLPTQVAFALMNMSDIYLERGDIENAEKYAQIGFEFATDYGHAGTLAKSQLSIARVMREKGDAEGARKIYLEAKEGIISAASNVDMAEYSYELYELSKETGHMPEALEALEKAYALQDTLHKKESQQSLDDALEKHNSEKKQLEIEKQKLRAEKEEAEKTEAENAKSTQFYIFLGIVLVLIFNVGFVYNRFRLTRKQNRIIEDQKTEIEVRQKEIVDSITYAKRLQRAILSPEETILKFFPNSFLLYKPKDIVAGDFYFFETTNTHAFYAAADCTGHGVPGAMVSIVCSNALTRTIKEFGCIEPGKILDKTRELVVETFEKSGENVKDGMDISLISKNLKTNEIKWAGAHNALWIIENENWTEIKPDKQPIGKSDHATEFATHTVTINDGALLYLITDGYADQFGGPKGKKFKASNLKDLLVKNSMKPMTEQKEVLYREFENWKGGLEQVDDVCVIGVKL